MLWITAAVLAVACWLLYGKFLYVPYDAKEPPLIPQPFPYFGHIARIVRDGSSYYSKISARYSLPIYTLRVPGSKIYIVNSPNLAAAVDRNAKNINFGPYMIQFVKRIMIPSQHAIDALAVSLLDGDGTGLGPDTLKAMHAGLGPGQNLDAASQNMVGTVARLLETVDSIPNHENFELFAWGRKLVTRASTDAIYGARKNPFHDPAVEAGFWAVAKGFGLLGLNILLNITARKAIRGRATFFEAFKKYYREEGYKSGSRLVQARYEVNRNYDISNNDIAHFDISICIAMLVNTVPASTWGIFYIYSQEALFKEARAKMSSFIRVSDTPEGPVHKVNVAEVIAGYPLLGSLVQEILRVRSNNASGRIVMHDTLLENRYLLKKNSPLLIPSPELHMNPSVWGPDVTTFDPERFIRNRAKGVKVPASVYRPWGSGHSLCPGRFLATNEMLIIITIMVLKYDLCPVNGPWVMPKCEPHIITSILTPVKDVRVKLTPRKGYEDVNWAFVWDGSGARPETDA